MAMQIEFSTAASSSGWSGDFYATNTPRNSPGSQSLLSLSPTPSFMSGLNNLAFTAAQTSRRTIDLSRMGEPLGSSPNLLIAAVPSKALTDNPINTKYRVTFVRAYESTTYKSTIHPKDVFRLLDSSRQTPEVINEGGTVFNDTRTTWNFYRDPPAESGIGVAGWYTLEAGIPRMAGRPERGTVWNSIARVVLGVDIRSSDFENTNDVIGNRTYVALEIGGEVELSVPHYIPFSPDEPSSASYETRIIQDYRGPWDDIEGSLFLRLLADYLFAFEVEPRSTERMRAIDLELGDDQYQGVRLVAFIALGYPIPTNQDGSLIDWPIRGKDDLDLTEPATRNVALGWTVLKPQDRVPRLLSDFIRKRIEKQYNNREAGLDWVQRNLSALESTCGAIRRALAAVSNSGGDVTVEASQNTANSIFLAHRYIGASTRVEVSRFTARDFARVYRFRLSRVLNLRGTVVGMANRTSVQTSGVVESRALPWIKYTDASLVSNPPISMASGEVSVVAIERELNRLMAGNPKDKVYSRASTHPLHQAIYINEDTTTKAVLAVRFAFTRVVTPVIRCRLGSTVRLALPPSFGPEVPVDVVWGVPDPAILGSAFSQPTGNELRITAYSDSYYGLYSALVREKGDKGDDAPTCRVTFELRQDTLLPPDTAEMLGLFIRVPETFRVFDTYLLDSLALPERNTRHAEHAVALQQLVNLHGDSARFSLIPTAVDLRAIIGFDLDWHPPYLRYHVEDAMLPPASLVLWHPGRSAWRLVAFDLDPVEVEEIAAADNRGIAILKAAREVLRPYMAALPASTTTVPIDTGLLDFSNMTGPLTEAITMQIAFDKATNGGHISSPLQPPIRSALIDESYETWIPLQPELRAARNKAGLSDTHLLDLPVRLVHVWLGKLADATDNGTGRQNVFAAVHRQLGWNLEVFWQFAREDNPHLRSRPSLPDIALLGAVTHPSVKKAWAVNMKDLPRAIRRKVSDKWLDDAPPQGTPDYLVQRQLLNAAKPGKSQVSLYQAGRTAVNEYDLEKFEWTITYHQMVSLAQELLGDEWIGDKLPAYNRYPASSTERQADAARQVFAFTVPDARPLSERPEARSVLMAVADSWRTLEEPLDVQLNRIMRAYTNRDFDQAKFAKSMADVQKKAIDISAKLYTYRKAALIDNDYAALAPALLLDVERKAAEEAADWNNLDLSESDEDWSNLDLSESYEDLSDLESNDSEEELKEEKKEEKESEEGKDLSDFEDLNEEDDTDNSDFEKELAAEAEAERKRSEEEAAEAEAERKRSEEEAAAEAERKRQEEEAAAEAERKRLEEEEAAAEAERKRLEEEAAAAEAERKRLEEEAVAAEAERKRLAEEAAAAEAERKRLEEEEAAAEAERKRLAEEAAEAERERLDEEAAAAAEAERKRLEEEEATAEAERKRLAEEAAVAEAERKRLEEEAAAAEAERKRLAEEAAAAEAERKRLEEEAAAEAERKRLEEERASSELNAARELSAELKDKIDARTADWGQSNDKEVITNLSSAFGDFLAKSDSPTDVLGYAENLLNKFLVSYHKLHDGDILLPGRKLSGLFVSIMKDPSQFESVLAQHEEDAQAILRQAGAQVGEISKHAEDLVAQLAESAKLSGEPAADDALGQELVSWNAGQAGIISAAAAKIAGMIDPEASQNAIDAGFMDQANELANSLAIISARAKAVTGSDNDGARVDSDVSSFKDNTIQLGDRLVRLGSAVRRTTALVAKLTKVRLNQYKTLVKKPQNVSIRVNNTKHDNFLTALISKGKEPEVFSGSDKETLLKDLAGGKIYEFVLSDDENKPFSASPNVSQDRLKSLIAIADNVAVYNGTIGPEAYGIGTTETISGELRKWLVDVGAFPLFKNKEDAKPPVLIAGFDADAPGTLMLVKAIDFVGSKNNANPLLFLNRQNVRAMTLKSWIQTMADKKPPEVASSEAQINAQIDNALSFVGTALSGLRFITTSSDDDDDTVYHA